MEPEKGTFCVIKARNQSNKNLRHMLLGGRIKGKSEKIKKTKTVRVLTQNIYQKFFHVIFNVEKLVMYKFTGCFY